MDNNKTLTFLIDLCAQLNIIVDTIFDLLLDKNILSENEFVVSNALNDLNDRVLALENYSYPDFVTAEEVVDIHSIQL